MQRTSRGDIQARLRRVQRFARSLPGEAAEHFRSVTPIRTGNARSNTELRGGKNITANYAYANRLNEGYSGQAPQGMTEPTIAWIRSQLRGL